MKITVIGCGRWGTFIAWYLDRIGHQVSLYGRAGSTHLEELRKNHSNGLVKVPDSIKLTDDLDSISEADIIVISINSQGLRKLMGELQQYKLFNKDFILCMKGIEIETGCRLTQVVKENTSLTNRVSVWLGPGHVQEFTKEIPNCMVIDSEDETAVERLVGLFSGDLIRFYYGQDLIGNEIGAAAKNVIGIAAGMLDGLHLSTLKGALMSRGTREIARLIKAMGGNELSAYGLCHLGDYEATVFSEFSHNRKFGELFVQGEAYTNLAEGFYTVKALKNLEEEYQVELPICNGVYEVLYEKRNPGETLNKLFTRSLKNEF